MDEATQCVFDDLPWYQYLFEHGPGPDAWVGAERAIACACDLYEREMRRRRALGQP